MAARRVAIIDSGGANIASLLYAFSRLGVDAQLTTDAAQIKCAERVLLPGVGAAQDAMTRLRNHNLIDVVRKLEQPVLGICLGMQLLADASEEEDVECLGIIPGVVSKLPASPSRPVPNMGWCAIDQTGQHSVLRSIGNGSYFYFLHSYALPAGDYTVATAEHAAPFSAIVSHNNFVAAQFHPERSSTAGSQLLRNFVESPA
jgi:imidazole glycerol-phosphate synthase subunit HisH